MKGVNKPGRRKWSGGTVLMLALLIAVLGGSALVLGKLSSGASVDLSKLKMNALDIREDSPADPEPDRAEKAPAAVTEASRAAVNTPLPKAEPVPKTGSNSFTLTVAGSLSLSGEVRKNSKSTDAKTADYSDIMMLLAPKIRSDVNIVFLEGVLSNRHKASDSVAPEEAASILKEAGFGMAACGFSQSYACGKDGIEATLMALDRQGIAALGIRYADGAGEPDIRTAGGVKAAFLQYTAGVSAKTRKTMAKEGTDGMVPDADADLIAQEISVAREQGAEAVIVLMNWGGIGKDVTRAQRELAGKIAGAGADLIIGNGSRIPQTAEYLPGANGRSVLCVWSLGTLLSGDRANVRRISGYLLHVTVQNDGKGGALILNPEFSPVYTWKYKQDGRYYYRCVLADGEAPDGMDSEQRKMMARAAETVAAVLKNAPLSERGQTDGP